MTVVSKFNTVNDPIYGNVTVPMTQSQYVAKNAAANPIATAPSTAGGGRATSSSPSISDIFSSAEPYRQQAQQDLTRAGQVTASAGELPTLLKQALNEKLSSGALVQEGGQAATGFLSKLGQAPAQVLPQNTGGVVLSPGDQAALISGYRGSSRAPLIMANQRYDVNTGSIADIISASGAQANKMAQLAQSQAGVSRQSYEDIVNKLTTGANMDWEREKFGKQMELDYAKLAKSGSGAKKIDAGIAKQLAAAQQAVTNTQELRGTLANLGTGPSSGIGATIQRLTGLKIPGLYKEDTAQASTAISQANVKLFDLAGKALTGTEQSVLNGLKLDVHDTPDIITEKLDGWENLFNNSYSQAVLQAQLGQLTSNFYDDWEAVQ